MKTLPIHTFITKSHDLTGLFADTQKLSKFMRNLEKQSDFDPIRYDPLKYLGDGFEFFIEMFLLFHPVDNRVGVSHYSPNEVNDNGVDGTGLNIRNEPCVVQIKFRSDVMERLSTNRDHLSNLITDGMMAFNVMADNTNPKNYRHFVFTTSMGLNFYTDNEMFKNKVKCFGYNELRKKIDNNIPFWNYVREIVKQIDPKLKNKQ